MFSFSPSMSLLLSSPGLPCVPCVLCRSLCDRGRCPPAFDLPTLDVDAVPRRQKNSTICRHIAQAFLPLSPKTRPAFSNR
ncbi:hypothetical protein C8R44DRAFT_984726 [Mycena epipterygia]|nr:hypothetical protein C8R44DRAFT_984726 [Mycena epipterygia]